MNVWEARGRVLVAAEDPVPRIMGVVNTTPDSFSDGGKHDTATAAIAHALRLVDDGADLLDIGGESSRPGAAMVPVDEELRRVLPVVAGLSATCPIPISIDTTKAEVARRALEAGALIVNDIQGLTGDPELTRVVVEAGAGVVLMHMAGTPATMQNHPTYHDVVIEVHDFLARRIDAAEQAGIPRSHIAIDPGIGFGKTNDHNLQLLRNLRRFASLGCVVLIGTSRKGLLGKITGRPVEQRATASAVSALAAATQGARVLRVHDVGATADAVKIWSAQVGWGS